MKRFNSRTRAADSGALLDPLPFTRLGIKSLEGIVMQFSSIAPKASVVKAMSEKVTYRRLTWLVIASVSGICTTPVGAQSSSANGLSRASVEALLTCRGFFEAFPKSGDEKLDDNVEMSYEMIVAYSDNPDIRENIRKQISSENERKKYLDEGREIAGSEKRIVGQLKKCVDISSALFEAFK